MTEVAATHEIDLIPSDYRKERALLRAARQCGLLVAVLTCTALVAAGALYRAASATRTEVARLNAAAGLAEQQRAAIAALTQQKESLEISARLHAGLRAKAPIDELMAVIGNAAAEAGVWFRAWQFRRLGAVVRAAPAGTEDFFMVEPGADGSRVRSRIAISGRARDLEAVSALVQALAGAPELTEVQVQRVSRDQADGVVDIELALVADSATSVQ